MMRVWYRGRWMRPLWMLGYAIAGFMASADAMADDGPVVVGLSGVLTDAATAAPVTCGAVGLLPLDGGDPVVAVTDANGNYFFEVQPPGLYDVRVTAPGYDPAELSSPLEADTARVRNFALTPRAGPVIGGTVMTLGSGRGIAGARVELSLLEGEPIVEVFACADGRYEIGLADLNLTSLEDTLAFNLTGSGRGHRTQTFQVLMDPASSITVDLELLSATGSAVPAALVGALLGLESGGAAPIADAQLTLRGPLNFTTQPEEDGLYAIFSLPPGRYVVTASAPRHTTQNIQRTLAEFEVGEASFQLEPFPKGDINGDGVVNAVDVQLVINAALGHPLAASEHADINGDGVVNAVDVQLVINAALGIDIEG